MTLKDFFPKSSADNDGERKKPNKIIIFVIISAVVLLAASSFFDFKSNPSGKSAADSDNFDAAAYITEQERRLEQILEKINGAGKVSVYITASGGGEKTLARDSKNKMSKDSDKGGGESYDEESDSTVVGTKSGGEPYVTEQKMPEIDGVLVVASGAASEKVRLEIYDAVKALYGIAAHRIKISY